MAPATTPTQRPFSWRLSLESGARTIFALAVVAYLEDLPVCFWQTADRAGPWGHFESSAGLMKLKPSQIHSLVYERCLFALDFGPRQCLTLE